MNDNVLKFGRYRFTGKFGQRVLNYYSRQIRRGELPTTILRDLTNERFFANGVTVKVQEATHGIGGFKGFSEVPAALPGPVSSSDLPPVPETDWTLEHEAHDAFAKIAAHFDLPAPAEPKWPEPPAPESSEAGPGESSDDAADGDGDKDGESGKGESSADDAGLASDGDDQDGDGDGDGDSEEEGGGTAQKGAGGPQAGQSNKGSSDKAGEGSGESTKAERRAAPPVELHLENEAPDLRSYTFAATLPDPTPTPLTRRSPGGYTDQGLRADKLGCASLLAKVREDLLSVSRHRITRNRDCGHVDVATKTAELAAGVDLDRVFYTSTHAKRLNAAVQILMDTSGSMGNGERSRMSTCCKLAYLLSTTLEKLRVPVQVLTHNGHATVVKDWHEKVDACRILEVASEGGNHLPSVMEKTIPIFCKQRREQRLIQVIVTDGDVGWQTQRSFDHYRQMKVDNPCGHSEIECPGRAQRWPAGYLVRLPGESNFGFQCRRAVWYSQNGIASRGYYRGDAATAIPYSLDDYKSVNMEQRLLKLYRENPRLQTYAFGIETDVPTGVFHRAFNALRHETMAEVITETITHALASHR